MKMFVYGADGYTYVCVYVSEDVPAANGGFIEMVRNNNTFYINLNIVRQ